MSKKKKYGRTPTSLFGSYVNDKQKAFNFTMNRMYDMLEEHTYYQEKTKFQAKIISGGTTGGTSPTEPSTGRVVPTNNGNFTFSYKIRFIEEDEVYNLHDDPWNYQDGTQRETLMSLQPDAIHETPASQASPLPCETIVSIEKIGATYFITNVVQYPEGFTANPSFATALLRTLFQPQAGAQGAFVGVGYNTSRTHVPISESQAQNIEEFIRKIKKSPSFKNWSGAAIAGVVANAQTESNFKQLAAGDSVRFYGRANVSARRLKNVRERNINGKCSWGYWQLNICPDDGSGKQLADSKGIDTTTQEGKEAWVKLMGNDEEQFKWVAEKMAKILTKGIQGNDPYQAGYDITVEFERPQDRFNKGITRGNLSASIYKKFQNILDKK